MPGLPHRNRRRPLARSRGRHPWAVAAAAVAVVAALLPPLAGAPVARAEANGVGLTPALGWSSWSSVRHGPTAAKIDAQADAMKSSGLAAAGFQYVNVDDFWYQCPGSQGPNVDGNGRWVTDTTKFPASGGSDGIKLTADHVHADGLKFGLYVTPGISSQAVAKNTPILGTAYHAADIATTTVEKNYNCKGMVGIDYSKPGAQAFIDSWADEFAAWGVDYVKIDGVGTSDVPDVQAWSAALRQTGRPIHLELSNNLAIGSAATWAQYSNGWRTGGDIECYSSCTPTAGTLTDWKHVQSRFAQVANWQPDGGPGGFNDYDSLEVGNGSATGLTDAEQQSQMSLWALAASPLILGTDLTALNATELGYLKNARVLAVDQDAIDASRVVNNGNQQVFAKTEADGSVVIGLFNYTDAGSTTVSVPLSAAGLSGSATATDLWSGASLGTISGTYSVTLGPGAVKLIKAVPSGSGGTVRIEAEATGNTLAGAAKVATCTACSGGKKIGYIGNGSANYVTINGITEPAAGSYTLTYTYLLSGTRTFDISVNGGADIVQTLTGSSFSTPVTASIQVSLKAGSNTIRFHNDAAYAPDLDVISVS